MKNKKIIEVKNIKKAFGSNMVLDGLSFDVKKGDVFGLLGHNGAGKTTILRIILGLLEVDSGELIVSGEDPFSAQENIRRKCGVLSEDNGLYESISVYDNLKFFAKAYNCYNEAFESKIDTLLEQFGILENKHDTIKNFSLGMKKKVAIIRTIFHEPEIVILDEPTNGLDPVSIKTLSDIINDLSKNKGITFIITTHNLDIVSKICNQVVIVKNGVNVYSSSLSSNDNDLVRTKIKYLNNKDKDVTKIIKKAIKNLKNEVDEKNMEIVLNTKDKMIISDIVSLLNAKDIKVYDINRNDFDLTSIYLRHDGEDKDV